MSRGETRDGMDHPGKNWSKFVRHANKVIDSGELARRQIDFKLKIGRQFEIARNAVRYNAHDWARLVEAGLDSKLIPSGTRTRIREWIEKSPDEASSAFKEIWTTDSLLIAERIHAFSDLLPKSVIDGLGTRTRLISVLLTGLDVTAYPPFETKKFRKAFKQTGFAPLDRNTDEAEWYEHTLRFLDLFLKEAQAHGARLRHRLDAQSIVWHWQELPDDLPELGSQPTEFKPLNALTDELLLSSDFLQEIDTLLEDKRQVIFQGPPGTGKTYVARKLAKCLAGSKNRVKFVQFHPSYAYEDFVRGFRPKTAENGQAGFELQDGPLLRAAQEARKEPDAKHFLIIDEINRGNLAKVFGELYFLLEYRDEKIRLQYQKDDEEDFSLSKNLFIIGTMNTADRSIALVDLALRRRFYFVEFHPDHEPIKSLLRRWLEKQGLQEMTWVADVVEKANELLQVDKHAAIGPSYFMKEDLDEDDVCRIWKHSVLPYIEERLFGDDNRLDEFNLDKLKDKAAQTRKQKENQEQSDGTGESNASAQ